MRGTDPIKSKWVCLKKNVCLRFSFIVILYLIIYVLFIECNIYKYIYIIVLGYSIKVIYVLICIIISRNLGKILFIEKLDVIKKIF
jgi:hypothetical protein